MRISRRKFFVKLGAGFSSAVGAFHTSLAKGDEPYIREAKYYDNFAHNIVECKLCPNECLIKENERGLCDVRENNGGILETLVYGRLCALNNDPIEKKPLYHFLPGTNAISIATAGCCLECKFCQNWEISQALPEDISYRYFRPEHLVDLTIKYKSPTIAYTYSEPIVFYEYMYDTSVIAKARNVRNAVVSSGYINPKPLKELCKVADAIKIDLKSFSQDFYRKLVSGQLNSVLKTLTIIKEQNIWLEIVYLIIPGHNDSTKELEDMAKWVVDNLGADVPLHFSRFYPHYLMTNLPQTPIETMDKADKIARNAGINFVYLGNIPQHSAENTYCPSCGKRIINRTGYMIRENNIEGGMCKFCNTKIPGIWS